MSECIGVHIMACLIMATDDTKNFNPPTTLRRVLRDRLILHYQIVMVTVIERALFGRQPPRVKLSAAQRHLPSHVVNLSGVVPTSDVRRRQLVQAQRRSREKARLLKRIALPVPPPNEFPLQPSRVEAYHSALTRRFVDYLALVTQFTKSQCPSTTPDMFSHDVQCDGSAGRHAVNAMWLQWATLFPGYQLSVVVIDVVAADNATANLTVRVEVKFHIEGTSLRALSPPCAVSSLCYRTLNTVVLAYGHIQVHFDGASARITSLQTNISCFQRTAVGTQRLKRRLGLASAPYVASTDKSKLSLHFILN
ncbi:hypothetical protein DYB30_011714 [Aphanomyces astaci]|uniref:Uncharacterized protein n=4 Tax=Aphanomyces astaci TaxID=112090 RepID=A0A397CP13_APHAT|nr:hypothetical protein DYB30_011714 [Aphanomyces astaci]